MKEKTLKGFMNGEKTRRRIVSMLGMTLFFIVGYAAAVKYPLQHPLGFIALFSLPVINLVLEYLAYFHTDRMIRLIRIVQRVF